MLATLARCTFYYKALCALSGEVTLSRRVSDFSRKVGHLKFLDSIIFAQAPSPVINTSAVTISVPVQNKSYLTLITSDM